MSNPEIRYNPFTDEWIIYSPKRQDRPNRNKDECPFCPGSEEIPEFKGPLRLPNKYPSLNTTVSTLKVLMGKFHKKAGGYGKSEIVIYTDKHDAKFVDLNKEEILEIFNIWMEATKDITKDQKIKYVLPFENYGKAVGASIIHPHGQIYGLSFVPKLIETEINVIDEYFKKEKKCMVCEYLLIEQQNKSQIIYEDNYIEALVPYFSQYAYDIFIYPKRHYGDFRQSTRRELESFAFLLPKCILALNKHFKKEISYSLSLHQKPFNCNKQFRYHLYFKIHTPQRNSNSEKLLGAVETSTGTFINGTLPEDAAMNIRNNLN